jgi:hypothetical protein
MVTGRGGARYSWRMKRAATILALALAATGCAPQRPTVYLAAPVPESPPATVEIPAPAVESAAPAAPFVPYEEPPSAPSPPAVALSWPPAVASPWPPATGGQGLPLDVVRDLRPGARSPRRPQLLVTEIQGLETLFASTPRNSVDRPRLIQRLAEAYAELANGARRNTVPATGLGKTTRIVQAGVRSAIRHYEELTRQYPGWCASPMPSSPTSAAGCAADALYYLGLERERDGDLPGARRAYFDLIQQHPTSRLVPSTYLAFGEMFLAESDADPSKLPLAEQSYAQALKYPPPDNVVYGYAQHQLGRVRAKRGDRAGATKAFKAAIAWAGANPSALGSGDLATASPRELAALGPP